MGKREIRIMVGAGLVAAAIAAVAVVWLLLPADDTPTARTSAPSTSPAARHAPTTSKAGQAGEKRGKSGKGPKLLWVVAENARPGTDAWRITGPHEGIEGYADRTSALAGEKVALFVSTDAPEFTVEAYRMGFYGGKRGRLVWKSPPTPGRLQAEAERDEATNRLEAPWEPSITVEVAKDWVPGEYLLKLVSASGAAQYVPLVVRDDRSKAPLVVVNAVTTWQAYNTWGGCSLYECPGQKGAKRAVVVSFDRPYGWGDGAGNFLDLELPLVALVEELGLDVTYWTDLDLHERGAQLSGQHRAVLSLGHDEYYSPAMFDAMERARDAGLNLAFFGANAMYRNVRFETGRTTAPNRRMVNYRSTKDPVYETDQRGETTVEWRSAPLARSEDRVVGIMYECAPTSADMVIVDASAWMFANTGVTDGTVLPKLIGDEYDRYYAGPNTPPNLQVLAHSPVTCNKKKSSADMTYYSHPSGAGVFASGTNDWICGIDASCTTPEAAALVKAVTTNLLKAFAEGPAGKKYPSASNVARFYG